MPPSTLSADEKLLLNMSSRLVEESEVVVVGVSSIASSGRANDVVVGVGDTATTCREWNSRKNDTARSYSCCCCSLVTEVAEEEDDADDDMVTLPRFFVCITMVV